MASKVKLFLEDMVNGVEIKGQVQLTEETVKSILLNETINVSEYQLFRFLYKWASHEEIPAQQLCSIAEECIDFAEFSSEQLIRTQIDCPKLNPDVLFNPFARSQILAEYDLKNLASDHRYSLVFKANAEDLSWAVLNNVLTSAVAKILIFKFLLGGMEWVCVLNLPQKLMSRDTVEVNDAEDVLPRVYLSIHQDKPDSKRLLLKDGYSISLSDQRLQIYQGSKHRTFISFDINDANDLSVVSIALDRFDPRLAAKYGVRLRKEAFVSFEVYCLDPMGAQISKIYRTVPPTAKEQTSSDSRGAIDETFNFMDEEFPFLGEEYGGINSEVEKELRELYDLLKSGDLTVVNFKKVLQQLKGMKGYPMERHEWACMLESLLDECGIPLGSQDDYLSLLVYLLDGLKKCSIRIMIGRRINTTLLERIRRVLERMRTNDVFLSVENIFHLFETLLFAHDWVTSSFVVTLLKEDHFPIAQGTFLPHENVKAYFIHWTSLLYLEILEEIKELEEQDMNMRENRTILQGMIISETKDNDETPTSECTLFVQEGDATFNQGDFLALSPTNASHVFRERKYIVDVKSVAGKHFFVDIVWPKLQDTEKEGKEYRKIMQDMQRHPWKIVSFPNLVSFNRMLNSLRSLCSAESLDNDEVFKKLLSTWGEQHESSRINETRKRTAGETSAETSSLNRSQQLAVQQACSNHTITLIQGPPGTGKSRTSAYIIQGFLKDPESKVLAVAETNEGVDNLMEKIIEVATSITEGELLRLGSSMWSVREKLRKYTMESRYTDLTGGKRVKENRMDSKFVKLIVDKAKVICTTCSTAGSKILEKTKFSQLLVDEASQATEPAILVPISRGCKVLVLVGDDKQLPPTIMCPKASELSRTTFNRLCYAGEPVYLLDIQYRMHPAISRFPARAFYDGMLKDGVSEEQRQAPRGFSWPDIRRPVAFVDMGKDAKEKGGRSKRNTQEAIVAKRIVTDLLRERDVEPDQIGVVTPYKAQVNLLKVEMKGNPNVAVRTVDGFQGQEREVIVFSAVRSNDLGHLGFLNDNQRMNVLLTRARRGFIVIGNKMTLKDSDKNSTWNNWVEWIEQENLIVDSAAFLPDISNQTTGEGSRQNQAYGAASVRGRRGRGGTGGMGRGGGGGYGRVKSGGEERRGGGRSRTGTGREGGRGRGGKMAQGR